jgi:hypothetical protein
MERLKNEYAEMSNVKKVVLGSLLLAAAVFTALLLTGVIDPFAI